MPTELPIQEMTNPHLLLNLSSVIIFFERMDILLSFLILEVLQGVLL